MEEENKKEIPVDDAAEVDDGQLDENKKEKIVRARKLDNLARTPYDKKIIRQAIDDGLSDNNIKVLLGYNPAKNPHKNPALPEIQEIETGKIKGPPTAEDEKKEAVKLPKIEGQEVKGNVFSHLAGLFSQLSGSSKGKPNE